MKSRRTVPGCEVEELQLMVFTGLLRIEHNGTVTASAAGAFHVGEVANAHNIPIDVTNVPKGVESGFKRKFNEISCLLRFGGRLGNKL